MIEVTEQIEEASKQNPLIAQFEKDIKTCEEDKHWKDALEQIKLNREAVDKKDAHINMLHSTNMAMLPSIYAKNPEISAIPSPKAGKGGDKYMTARKFSETLQIVVNRSLKLAKLKVKGKRMVRSMQTSKMGWLKAVYQREFNDTPMMRSKLADAQDNLARLETKNRDIESGELTNDELEAEMQKADGIVKSLQAQTEVVVAEGLVIDHIDTTHMRMSPDIPCVQDYCDSPWIAHYEEFTKDYIKTRWSKTDEEIKSLTKYSDKTLEAENKGNELYRVWERWDRDTTTVYKWIEGATDWLQDPEPRELVGERWYPFFGYGVHWLDGQKWPKSDVELLIELQKEYEETRVSERKVRKGSKAYVVADSQELDPQTVTKVATVDDVDIIVMDLGGQGVSKSLQPGVMPPYNPALYDTTRIRSDMEFAVNLSDAARGGVENTKTLGEAEILNSHMANRANERVDEIEEMFTELAEYVAEILLLALDLEKVKMIAGDDAFWPDLSKQEMFELVDVEIRAGSTTKPDRGREQKQWTELLPEVKETVQAVMQLRQAQVDPATGAVIAEGIPDELNPMVWLLQETLKRFDERIDIEEVLPPQQAPELPPEPQGVPGIEQELPPELALLA